MSHKDTIFFLTKISVDGESDDVIDDSGDCDAKESPVRSLYTLLLTLICYFVFAMAAASAVHSPLSYATTTPGPSPLPHLKVPQPPPSPTLPCTGCSYKNLSYNLLGTI